MIDKIIRRLVSLAVAGSATIAVIPPSAQPSTAATPTLLTATVATDGSVSLRKGRRDVVRLKAGLYVLSVRDRSSSYAFRLKGPRPAVNRTTTKSYVGTMRWRVRLVRGTYAYSSDALMAAARGTFRVV